MKKFFQIFAIIATACAVSSCNTSAFYVSYSMLSGDKNAQVDRDKMKCLYVSDSMEVSYSIKNGFVVRNNSDKVLVIDLYNSTVGIDGSSVRFSNCETTTTYTTESNTTSQSRGATTNLGGIARALGVGGAIGAVASGVTVGGGSTNANTTSTTREVTRTEERYIAIAPHAYKAIGDKLRSNSQIKPRNLMDSYRQFEKQDVEVLEDDRVQLDMTLCYGFDNEDNFHYKYQFIFPYSVIYQKEKVHDMSMGGLKKYAQFHVAKKSNMIKFLYDPSIVSSDEDIHWSCFY